MEIPAPTRSIVLDEDFEMESALKLVGLKSAAHLNGKACYAHRFNSVTRRYEVKLMEFNEIKSVQPFNLEPLPIMDGVAAWVKFLQRDDLGESEGMVALRQLDRVNITIEMLQQTKVAKIVKAFSARFSESTVGATAQRLFAKWRAYFAKQAAEAKAKPQRKARAGLAKSKPEPSVPEAERCLALEAPGQQCQNRRQLPQLLCPTHQAMNQADRLPYGLHLGGKIGAKKSKTKDSGLDIPLKSPGPPGSANPSNPSSHVKPMACPSDAKPLLEAMRAASTENSRLDTLAALDKSPKHCMLQFIQDGGLEVLERWLRKSPDARLTCLKVLQKLPVALPNLQKANLIPAVEAIQEQESSAQAAAVLERWRSAGFLSETHRAAAPANAPSVEEAEAMAEAFGEPSSKRLRTEKDHPTSRKELDSLQKPAASGPGPSAEQEPFMVEPEAEPLPPGPQHPQHPQPRTPPLTHLPAARPEDTPEELQGLDPRIALVLMQNPDMLQFLRKHPSVLQDLDSEKIANICRLYKNARESNQALGTSDATGCTVSRVSVK